MNPEGGTDRERYLRTLHLDGALLELGPEEEAFFKAETGIQDTEELKKHIIETQQEAYKVSRCSLTDRYVYIAQSHCVFAFRSTRIPASAGLDSRSSRFPGCLHIHASSNW